MESLMGFIANVAILAFSLLTVLILIGILGSAGMLVSSETLQTAFRAIGV